ncbi:hypothetical protein JCM6882_008825 [Rhodosporidiobolus microsporus]
MPAPVQIARRESAFSPDPSRSPMLHPALSTSLSKSFGLNSPFSLSAMSTSLKDLSSSPGFSSMAMSLGRSFEERPKIEAQFFKNFTCCGLDLHDLHGLLEHFEECHVAFDDDGAASDGGMDLEGVEPAESEGTISGPPSPRLLAHGVRELKKSGLSAGSAFEAPDSPASQAHHHLDDGGMELDMEMGEEEDGSSPSSVGSASSHLTSNSAFQQGQQPAMSSFENPLPLHGSASKKKQAQVAAQQAQQQPPPPAQPQFGSSTGISPASTTIPSLPGVGLGGISSSQPGTPAAEASNPLDSSTPFLPGPSGTVNPAAALGAPPVVGAPLGGFAPSLLFPGGGGAPVASTSNSQSPPPPVGMGIGAGLVGAGLGGMGAHEMGYEMGEGEGLEEEEEETEEDESDEDDTDDEEEDEQQGRQQAQFLLHQYQQQATQHGLGTLPFLPPGALPPVPAPVPGGSSSHRSGQGSHHTRHPQPNQHTKKNAAAASNLAGAGAAPPASLPSHALPTINPHDPHTIAALANTTLKDPMQTAAAIAALGPNSLAALPTALHPLGQGVQISPSGRPYTPPSEKPFKCTVPGCDKSYKQQNGLKYHRLHGHCGANAVRDGVDPRSEGKPYVCHVASCGKRYKNMNGLRYHYQHSGAHGALGLQMLAQGCHPPPQFPPGHKRGTGPGGGGSPMHQLAQSYIPGGHHGHHGGGGSASSSRASSPHHYGAVRGVEMHHGRYA